MCNELYKVFIALIVKYFLKINHNLIAVTLDICQLHVLKSAAEHDWLLLFVQGWDL